ncbi:MAG TPA: class I adenylate-forming enzyme family protein [Caulobacteraceae bacterium]|jgi:acyl-coenzyme A synthetase/AMP-(fatty) acid ligase|nr:class I adenylate-forming enzyme family protein [Caulobacteraceae bacterium]
MADDHLARAAPVVDRIFGFAARAPDKPALIVTGDGARTLTYREFAARIALMRGFLARQPLALDRVAVLCIADLAEVWIIGLALRGLGVTTLHFNSPDYIDRLGFDRPTVVAVAAESWPGLAEAAARGGGLLILTPREVYDGWPEAEAAAPAPGPAGGHILLTSGTTGVYKKVLITAAGEAANLAFRTDLYGLSGQSIVNVFSMGGWTSVGYHLPATVWSLGGGAVFHHGPDSWRSLAQAPCTAAFTHPELLAALLATPEDALARNDAMMLMVTSGPLSRANWQAARERLTRDVRTCIGSTETGGISLTRIETADDLNWHRIHPGREVQVVDEADRPLPAGAVGVLRVRATGVDAYLGDAPASAAFFRGGYFYPGDLGVRRDDGRIALQGRVTDVINVMGHKRAAAPIEARLQDSLGAPAVCVFSVPGADGEAVHVAIQPGQPITAEQLKAALLEALPGVAGAHVHMVEAFPRNATGKIDRAALRARTLGR